MKPTARAFKDELIARISDHPTKDNWDKEELVQKIERWYGNFLERYLED